MECFQNDKSHQQGSLGFAIFEQLNMSLVEVAALLLIDYWYALASAC
jgi:hypothetical protein